MKRRILKLTAAILSYAILNAGILGFVMVYRSLSQSGGSEAVMAHIDAENEDSVVFHVLGQSFYLDREAVRGMADSPAALAVCDPLLMAAWTVFKKFGWG